MLTFLKSPRFSFVFFFQISHRKFENSSLNLLVSPWFWNLKTCGTPAWGDKTKLGTSATASEFCEWFKVGIDVYIPPRKYQVKPHSSPWFSAASAAAIVHRNHFFRLYQREKSSDSKVKFRQASNCCKRVLEAAKLAYATETKTKRLHHFLQTWLLGLLANC